MSLGGYHWAAILEDGSQVNQFQDDGTERSVTDLREHTVTQLGLFPKEPTHACVIVEPRFGEDWVKHWDRRADFNAAGEQVGDTVTIDTVGLLTRSGDAVYLHIYPDGSMKFTTNPEP